FGNGWSPPSSPDATLYPGEGFFISSPTQITNSFVGDVLDARYYGAQTNSLRSGFELVGSKQPLTGLLPNLGLSPSHFYPFQDQILKWNVDHQRYDIYTRVAFGSGWSPTIPTNNVGEGFCTRLAVPYNCVANF